MEHGRKEGRNVGLQSGYMDGYAIGKVKALEVGIELGYMKSIALILMESGIVGRRKKKLQELLDAIESFPKPDELFSIKEEGKGVDANDDIDDNNTDANAENDTNGESYTGEKIDIMDKMQRIRAKFKTILVQMKIPHLTLKKVMSGEYESAILATAASASTAMNTPTGMLEDLSSLSLGEEQDKERPTPLNHNDANATRTRTRTRIPAPSSPVVVDNEW